MGLERERYRLGFIGSDIKIERYWGIGVYIEREIERERERLGFRD